MSLNLTNKQIVFRLQTQVPAIFFDTLGLVSNTIRIQFSSNETFRAVADAIVRVPYYIVHIVVYSPESTNWAHLREPPEMCESSIELTQSDGQPSDPIDATPEPTRCDDDDDVDPHTIKAEKC